MEGWFTFNAIVIFLGLIIGSIALRRKLNGPQLVRTGLPADLVVRRAIEEIARGGRWVVMTQSQDHVVMTRRGSKDWVGTFLLLWFFVIPAILYFAVSGRTQTLSISVFPESNGINTVRISADGRQARRTGGQFLRRLPGLMITGTAPVQQALPAQPTAGIPAGVLVSDDSQWWWDGQRWNPVSTPQEMTPTAYQLPSPN